MTLSVLTYNILVGGEDRLPFILRNIQRQQPDAVAIQEAHDRHNIETLAQQLGMHLIFGEANNGRSHVAWLSRLPVLNSENYSIPILTKTLLKIEVEDKTISSKPVALLTAHLKAGNNPVGEEQRVAEIQAIITQMQTLGEQPHVLVGDLNSLSPGDPIDIEAYLSFAPEEKRAQILEQANPENSRTTIPYLLQAGYLDCYRSLHPDTIEYTYHTAHPSLRIDYIFASPTLAPHLQACERVKSECTQTASDHFPVYADFR